MIDSVELGRIIGGQILPALVGIAAWILVSRWWKARKAKTPKSD